MAVDLVQSAPFEQTLSNRKIIASGHKKDLTIGFARVKIGASNTKCRIVTFALAPARQNIDYDRLHMFGHRFPGNMQIEC